MPVQATCAMLRAPNQLQQEMRHSSASLASDCHVEADYRIRSVLMTESAIAMGFSFTHTRGFDW